jgi:hypothetical protein
MISLYNKVIEAKNLESEKIKRAFFEEILNQATNCM